MSELDPNILKRNLPEDIHAAVDQVKDNVDSAVKSIVDGYRQFAHDKAEQFERLEFDAELRGKIEAIKADYAEDLDAVQDVVVKIAQIALAAKSQASAANADKLVQITEALTGQVSELSGKLKAFRDKTSHLAEKTGGLIAKSAIRAVTGGIG